MRRKVRGNRGGWGGGRREAGRKYNDSVSTELSRLPALGRIDKDILRSRAPSGIPAEVSSKNLSFCILPRVPTGLFHPEPLRSKSNKLEQWQSTRNIYSTRWKRIPQRPRSIDCFVNFRPSDKLSPSRDPTLSIYFSRDLR